MIKEFDRSKKIESISILASFIAETKTYQSFDLLSYFRRRLILIKTPFFSSYKSKNSSRHVVLPCKGVWQTLKQLLLLLLY